MSGTPIRRRPTRSQAEDDQVHAVAEQLRQHGWEARVACHQVIGDRDVRLEVSGPEPPAVELLDAWADAPCGDRWQAVRITRDSRVVWCGPSRPCPVDEIVTFVEELLQRTPTALARRYTALG
jgi:hypothetical protein